MLGGCGGAQARLAGHLERGREYLSQGNLEKARVEFRNALQIDPKSADASYLSGEVAEKLHNPREAATFYQSALDSDANDNRARAALGRLMVFGGAADQALKLVAPALAKTENADLLTVRASARFQTGDPQGALTDARRAVELAPDNENAIALLAAIYGRNGQNEEAFALVQAAVQRSPTSTALREVLAQMHAQLGNQAGAQTQLKELIALKPDEQRYRYQLAMSYLADGRLQEAEAVLRDAVKSNPSAVAPKLTLVDFLARHRSPAVAKTELEQFIAAEPDSVDLRFGLASLYEASRDIDRAESVYEDIVTRERSGAAGLRARNRIATLKMQAGKLDEAAALANEVLKVSPRDNDALVLRGNIALAQDQPDAAIADLRAVLRDQPNSPPLLRLLARAHLANNDVALAEEALKSAVAADPKSVEARIDLAELVASRGEQPQALALLEQVVLDAPDHLPAREALFRLQAAMHDLAAARRTAEDIKLQRPDLARGYYLAGMIDQAQRQEDQARREYEKALELQPDAAEPLTALVRADVAAKRTDAATARLRSMIQKFPQDVVARNLLGEVLIAERKPAEARAVLAQAVSIAPKWWMPYRTMALACLTERDKGCAIDAYRRGLAAAPDSIELASDLATLHERDGQPDAAIRVYESLLARNPRSDVASNNLAMLLVTYRKDRASLDRARDLVQKFSASSDPVYLDTHGWVEFKRGEVEAALPVLEQVAEKLPESSVIRYHLAMAQLRAGRLGPARDNLERALKGGANFAGAAEARAALDELVRKGSG
jgi:tetratricopeptide (TPR) repeat protein